MMRIITTLTAVFVAGDIGLAGALEATPTWDATDTAQTIRLADEARPLFDDVLTDYPSARFRHVNGVWSPNKDNTKSYTICGEVNSRSTDGGYTGWQSFVITRTDTQIVVSMTPDFYWNFCTPMSPIKLVINYGIDFSRELVPHKS
jgi:hypothetical protein